MAGEVLKKKREELGLELRKVAEALRLRPEYLDAIENDLFDKLPVAVYTKGYIREYASYLKIDSESIIAHYNQHLSYPKPSTVFPISATRKKTSSAFLFAVLLAVAVAGGLVFFLYQKGNGTFLASRPAPLSAPVSPATVPVAPVQQPMPTPAQPPAEVVPAPAVQPAPRSGHRLVILAHEKTWVQVKFSDGKSEELLMRPGDEKSWDFSDSAVLRTGNAGGIKVKIDEREDIVPGTKGQVLTMTLPLP